jgi:CheY-like chemotaxis protein
MDVSTAGLIMHVDDERSVRQSMSVLLGTDGYEVSSVANGTDALNLASGGFHPDVLIVDFNLDQGMTGVAVAQQVSRTLRYFPPLIILSGNIDNARFLPCITEVPVWLARKPLNPQLLLAALPGLVQLSRATRKLLTRSP